MHAHMYGASNRCMNICRASNICMHIYGASNMCMHIFLEHLIYIYICMNIYRASNTCQNIYGAPSICMNKCSKLKTAKHFKFTARTTSVLVSCSWHFRRPRKWPCLDTYRFDMSLSLYIYMYVYIRIYVAVLIKQLIILN